MSDENIIHEDSPSMTSSVGDKLRSARETAGMSLEQVAAETRIPQRHLITIEQGSLSDLPARTYAVGFSRTYARLVGLDEQEIINQVRGELADGEYGREAPSAKFEPGDPARVPGRGLVLFAIFAGVVLLGGIYAFYSSYLAPGLGPAPLRDRSEQVAEVRRGQGAEPAPTRTAAASGPVVFTSEMDGTWVKFYDASGQRLYEAQMNEGDSFTVPSDAEGPQVWTGRPYALAITIGGRTVPKLSEEDEILKDVLVTAEALMARAEPNEAQQDASATPVGNPG